MEEDIALVVLPHLGNELHIHVLDIDLLLFVLLVMLPEFLEEW